jgi:prepilin-type N-terminal cleavage/methylation domain-containing protein
VIRANASSEVRSVRHAHRGGFTMVEVIVAITILTVGVLAMASTTAYVVRQTTFADLLTERAAAFQTVVDKLQAMPYTSVTTGSETIGLFTTTWSSVDDGAQSKLVTIVSVGPGLDQSGSSPYPVMSRVAVDTFVFRKLRIN